MGLEELERIEKEAVPNLFALKSAYADAFD
jgi:hypothetical protein